jgi:hypothetical protein
MIMATMYLYGRLLKNQFMKPYFFVFLFFTISYFASSQNAYFSPEVKAKMDQNKIDGVPTLNDIVFEHIVTISSGISDATYKNNDIKINEAIISIKNELELLNANFDRLESGDLIIHFIDDVENSIDSIKIALTTKNLLASSFEVVAKIVQ